MAIARLGLALSYGVTAFALGACTDAVVDDGGGAGTAGTGSAGATAGSPGASSTVGGTGAGAGGSGGNASGGVSTAGTGVDGTAAGAGGASTAGAAGAADPGAKPSLGCNNPATQALETFVEAKVTAKGFQRQYFVRLPAGYDPARPYSTVVVGAACGGNGMNGIPIRDAAKNDAIVVGLSPSQEVAGRDCFMTESATSPEIDFFDAALSAVEAAYCVDQNRIFMEGFSSGSWLTNLIGCARGNVLRGQGNASGGPPPLPPCTGPIATIMVHDTTDGANSYEGGKQTRDRIRQLNGCSDQTAPWDAAYPECVAYQGCPAAYPLVFCTTTGKGHTENVPFSTEGFWTFWSSLPAKE
jgi:poly(3-hydroxybutyrate) depolymerase